MLGRPFIFFQLGTPVHGRQKRRQTRSREEVVTVVAGEAGGVSQSVSPQTSAWHAQPPPLLGVETTRSTECRNLNLKEKALV